MESDDEEEETVQSGSSRVGKWKCNVMRESKGVPDWYGDKSSSGSFDRGDRFGKL